MMKTLTRLSPLLLLINAACAAGSDVRGFRFMENFNKDPAGNTLSVITLAVMLISVVGVGIAYVNNRPTPFKRLPAWALPALAAVGLGVSIYLTYIEVSKSEAFCGPLGNCNAVQTSEYAKLFGIPVGVLGIVGYVAILAAWLVQQRGGRGAQKNASVALWLMAWLGILFSIYLTFLEPFVIGATCIWCITSAVVMTLVLWATTDRATQALG